MLLSLAPALLALALQTTPAQPLRQVPAPEAQKLLDTIAHSAPPRLFNLDLPPAYADWTDLQKRQGPNQVTQRCVMLSAMMYDAGPIQIIAPAQDASDNVKLPILICSVAHMPADWSARPTVLAEIKRILARSTQLGKPLSLPPALTK